MGQYWDVIKSSWKEQNKRPRLRLGRNEREFQAAAIEILETPASPAGRTLGILLMVFIVIALGWSAFGRIEIYATLSGKIIPTGQVKVIEPLITGTVRSVRVEPGQSVEAGDLLIELDPTEHSAERTKLEEDLLASELVSTRLRRTFGAVLKDEPAEAVVLKAALGTPGSVLDSNSGFFSARLWLIGRNWKASPLRSSSGAWNASAPRQPSRNAGNWLGS